MGTSTGNTGWVNIDFQSQQDTISVKLGYPDSHLNRKSNSKEKVALSVTSKDIEISQSFNMDCVKDLSEWVSYREAQKFDDQIRKNCQNTSVDLILADGVQHNWDQAGEIDLMADWVNPWIKHRAGKDSKRVPDHLLSDHLQLKTHNS
ncbi:hypothetical protein PPACK8108_LOCUS21306 [Phakopsora pachyrhizi]|uniref:Uncharacterized protein n=1 Tax=Phakopsora pachyrhizi TaxID=170000 RepID=A0AAV0BH28_PHAPC|nr:hypothetical protein PPACK8108_LOCUS21306 [Phakopsora pachyrhizi]